MLLSMPQREPLQMVRALRQLLAQGTWRSRQWPLGTQLGQLRRQVRLQLRLLIAYTTKQLPLWQEALQLPLQWILVSPIRLLRLLGKLLPTQYMEAAPSLRPNRLAQAKQRRLWLQGR